MRQGSTPPQILQKINPVPCQNQDIYEIVFVLAVHSKFSGIVSVNVSSEKTDHSHHYQCQVLSLVWS